jgi:hypothetical protein
MSLDEPEIQVDTRKANQELDALKQHAEITAQGVIRQLNRTYMASRLFLDIFHVQIPWMFDLMISAALMAGQTFADLATAETISGVMAWKAGATLMAAALMFNRAMILQQQKSLVEESINSTIHFLDVVTR